MDEIVDTEAVHIIVCTKQPPLTFTNLSPLCYQVYSS